MIRSAHLSHAVIIDGNSPWKVTSSFMMLDHTGSCRLRIGQGLTVIFEIQLVVKAMD